MGKKVRIDKKGRIVIPKEMREKIGITEGSYVELEVYNKNAIIIKPLESIADRYFGIFKVEEYPDDIDEFLKKEVIRKWLRDQSM
ncbi:AbrB/MazE/SpoVT family DNA-binding domain-containing protein [Pyrococcus kukulkanii]